MIACLQLPRFELTVAVGSHAEPLTGPVALAPEAGREPVVGVPSAAAEASGVRHGMRLGEALARCPTLRMVAPDPAGVADAHDLMLARLEAIGAAVESGGPGVVCFDAHALRHLHGPVERVMEAARKAVRTPARAGAGPSRFAALAAASRARARRTEFVPGSPRAFLAPLPVSLLALRAGAGPQTRTGPDAAAPTLAALPESLERFGIRTLGELAKLPRASMADRFGPAGLLALDLAKGRDTRLRPRDPMETLEERLELPESASGQQLEHALGLLIDRLLARSERRGRPLRAVVLSAVLVEGGTWRERMVFREPVSDPQRMRLVLVPKLGTLPAPADVLRVRAEGFGPAGGAQGELSSAAFGADGAAGARSARLREAIRQTRAAAGPEAALRILCVDPDSRVPERRLVLAPWDA